jgi:hypothetical protein
MSVPTDWQNVAVSRESIEEGDEIAMEVTGGFVRRPAPSAGTLYRLASGAEVFVPKSVEEPICTSLGPNHPER